MTKIKEVVQNIKPYHSEIRTYEKGFTWTFHANMTNGDDSKIKVIRLKFDRWWIIYLAKELISVLVWERAEVNRIIDLSGFKIEEIDSAEKEKTDDTK